MKELYQRYQFTCDGCQRTTLVDGPENLVLPPHWTVNTRIVPAAAAGFITRVVEHRCSRCSA